MLTRDDLLALREDSDFEVKAAQGRDGRGELPQSVWETYSALANTGGGRILLGAKERKDGSLILQGIADVQRVRKALWDGVNNRQVVSHNLLGNDDVEVLSVEDAEYPLILVSVPGATRKQRPVYTGVNPLTGTYRRNYEGDYRCDTETVRRMLAEAERDTRDSEILKGFGLDDLDPDSLSTFRNLFSATKPGHPWLALEDRELLRRLGGWARDREQNVEGPTLAGLLMFGQLHTIREVLPNFILDYQERLDSDPKVRWTNRITTDGTWSGNLLDFYRRVYPWLVDGVRVPFRLEAGVQRIDETAIHVAIREALVNTLIHADYSLSTGILISKHPDHYEFRNPGGLRIPRTLAIQGGVSDCRNRNLQKMFQMIGAGEQAGSGVSRIISAWREQHWRAPLLEEHPDPERTTLHLSMMSLFPPDVIDELTGLFGDAYRALSEVQRLALATARAEGQVTNERLREMSGEHPSDLTVLLRGLVGAGFLERQGNGRGAFYHLSEDIGAPALQVDLLRNLSGEGQKLPLSESPLLTSLPVRQRRIMERVLEHGFITNAEHREACAVSRATATRDLQTLVDRGILVKEGGSYATRYVLRRSDQESVG
jgi:predicted HTH transcriptional regulator